MERIRRRGSFVERFGREVADDDDGSGGPCVVEEEEGVSCSLDPGALWRTLCNLVPRLDFCEDMIRLQCPSRPLLYVTSDDCRDRTKVTKAVAFSLSLLFQLVCFSTWIQYRQKYDDWRLLGETNDDDLHGEIVATTFFDQRKSVLE